MVEHSPYHPKVKGFSPATAAGTGREIMLIKRFTCSGELVLDHPSLPVCPDLHPLTEEQGSGHPLMSERGGDHPFPVRVSAHPWFPVLSCLQIDI